MVSNKLLDSTKGLVTNFQLKAVKFCEKYAYYVNKLRQNVGLETWK